MSTTHSYYSHERPELVIRIASNAQRILDLGCGIGTMSTAIKQRATHGEIWGVEVVPEIARQAQQNPAFHRVLCGNIETLVEDLPDGYFDYIVAGDVLEHLVNPWTAVTKLRNKMAAGGTFLCSIPNIRNFSFIGKLLFKKSFEYRDAGVMDRTHLRFFARKDVVRMFLDAGFNQVDIQPLRPKNNLDKKIVRFLFGDLVLKGFLVIANHKSSAVG